MISDYQGNDAEGIENIRHIIQLLLSLIISHVRIAIDRADRINNYLKIMNARTVRVYI